MAQARRRQPQKGASNGLPGWAMLTIGLIIGLFVAFLVYLDDLDAPPNAAVEAPDPSMPGAEGQPVGGDGEDGEAAVEKPRFEFYSILPELEVVVPDQPADKPRASKDAPDDEGGAGTGDAGDGEDTGAPPPSATGRMYLQAGSFQEEKQADRMKAQIALLGLDVAIQTVQINGERWHRVRVGPFEEPTRLRQAQQRLRANGIDYLVLREKQPSG